MVWRPSSRASSQAPPAAGGPRRRRGQSLRRGARAGGPAEPGPAHLAAISGTRMRADYRCSYVIPKALPFCNVRQVTKIYIFLFLKLPVRRISPQTKFCFGAGTFTGARAGAPEFAGVLGGPPLTPRPRPGRARGRAPRLPHELEHVSLPPPRPGAAGRRREPRSKRRLRVRLAGEDHRRGPPD